MIDTIHKWAANLIFFYVIVQIRDEGLYRDFKVRVLFNARGLCNPGKVRRRVFELTSQTY